MTQLVHVADRSPVLVRLRALENKTPSRLCVVKIRPTLLHFVADGRVWCVIRSKIPITDVVGYGLDCSSGEKRHKILVSAADGNVWVVTLPGKLQPGVGVVTGELLLERSSSDSCGEMVKWFCQLPGVQSVDHTPAGSGLTSLTLMRSLVTPSTLIVSTRGSSESKLQRHQWLELDEMEGEQSTCTICLNSQESRHSTLITSLFPDAAKYAGTAAILQGDLDGWVRFSLVHYPCVKGDVAKASVIRSGALARLDQPVQMISPFTASVTSSLPTGDGNDEAAFDALLVLGSRGQVGIVDFRNSGRVEKFPVSLRKLDIGRAAQSLVFVDELKVCVYCSSGSAFVCRAGDMLVRAHHSNDSTDAFAEKLPLPQGILRLVSLDNGQGISILFSSGRIISVDEPALNAMVSAVLPKTPGDQRSSSKGEPPSEHRVRNLLHRIEQVSTESTVLRTQSKQMNHQLKALYSALEMLRVVETTGVAKCDLGASIVSTGNLSNRPTVKLVFSLRFVSPEADVSSNQWWLCVYVRTRKCAVTSYSFPVENVFTGTKQSIVLDPDTLALRDQGALWASCSLIFCPSENVHRESKGGAANNSDSIEQEAPLSFTIPLIQDRRFLFAQLSQPIEEEIPVSQVAVQAAFRQSHDPILPLGRASHTDKEEKASSTALWSGVQWWAALADHAHKNPSFAAMWSKVAPSTLPLSPPSRFVISIPSFFVTEDDDDDEDEDFEKVRVERMVSFLRQLLEIPVEEVPRLRRSCRTQHGKLWTVLRALSGSLILLRFTTSEDQQRSVDLTIQCSDVADLSAMRALVLEAINNWRDGINRGVSAATYSKDLTLDDTSEMLEPISALENILEDLKLKTATGIEDPESAICTDEVLHALAQLAHVETQTLTLYWKTRLNINRTIM
ncbi:hypothetical protein PF008_g17106 [Phytophthora fragariae]|uniref:Uncharacterized protein n=1 Tax=Phytophthora fragariae TaxID=53985 RepID=A0A6G0RAE5_9STRA|nr:hypothetical protein PF008_g17106 [Phytophthora fragariae]